MFSFHTDRHTRWMLICTLLLFLVKAAFVALTPLRALVMSPWLIDDSFIVAQVARSIAEGHGFSFDTLHTTTGVSMLWTYVTSVNHVFLGDEAAIRATMILSTFFGALSAAVTFSIGRKMGGVGAAWIAFVLTALAPVLFFNAMNGMETSFFSLCILLGLAAGSGVWRVSPDPFRQGLWTGLFAGVAILTRADAIFLMAALILLYTWTWWRVPASRSAIVREVAGCCISFGACFALLLGWQMLQTGSLFPDNQIGRRAIALQKHRFDYAQFSLPVWGKIVVWNGFELDALWTLTVGSSLLGLFAFAAGLLKKETTRLAGLTGVYLLLFCGMLVVWQWYFPDFHGLRYINGAAHIIFVFIALLCTSFTTVRWRHMLVALFCAVLIVLSWYRFFDYARTFPSLKAMSLFGQRSADVQQTFWAGLEAFKELPADAVIAARDHGRLAYFTRHPVQDIAGIIDPQVLHEWKNGTLGTYLKSRNVAYVLLPDPMPGSPGIYQAVHEALTLELMPSLPPQEVTGYRMYQVQ